MGLAIMTAVCLWPVEPARAAAVLTVTGLRGTSALDLGDLDRAPAREEAAIVMDPDTAARYHLVQTVTTPLTNERGTVLPMDRVVIELKGGASGTRRFTSLAPISDYRMELFVSNAAGTPETLTLRYAVAPDDPPEAGTYVGALTYTLQSTTGGALRVRTVRMRLRVSPKLEVRLEPASRRRIGFDRLTPEQSAQSEPITLLITSNLPGRVVLKQGVDGLINERGDRLPVSSLRVWGTVDGRAVPEREMVIQATLFQQELAATTTRVELVYGITPPPSQRPGTYRGSLELAVSGLQSPYGDSLVVPLQVSIDQFLSLQVEPEGDESELRFGTVMPGQQRDVKVRVTVNTNMPHSYHVLQELARPFTSDQGRRLPDDILRFVLIDRVAGGLRATPPAPLARRKLPIYRAPGSGGRVEFELVYQVELPAGAPEGDYRGIIVYLVTPL
jgi:hypothetical protein